LVLSDTKGQRFAEDDECSMRERCHYCV